MSTISPSKTRNGTRERLAPAAGERTAGRRGRKETFGPATEACLEPDEDLRRAVGARELLAGIEADIREAFRKKHGINA